MLFFACKPAPGHNPYAPNIAAANTSVIVVLGLCLIAVGVYLLWRRGWGFPLTQILFFVLHPEWTISMKGGDCGWLTGATSYLVGFLAAVVLFSHIAYLVVTYLRVPDTEALGDYGEGPHGGRPDGRGHA